MNCSNGQSELLSIQSFIYIIVYIYELFFADPDMVLTGFHSYFKNSHQIIDII